MAVLMCLLLFCKFFIVLFVVSSLIQYFLLYISDNVLEGRRQQQVWH